MTRYFCTSALLETGWASSVLIDVNDDGSISDIKTDVSLAQIKQMTDCRSWSGCVVPGMPNLHSHAHQRAMAGLAEYPGATADSFWTWREIMYRAVHRLSPDDLEAIATQLYCEMLEAGYTHVCEFQYLHHDVNGGAYEDIAEMSLRCVSAAQTVGIGLTILPVFYANGGFGSQPPVSEQRRFTNSMESYLRIVESLDRHTEVLKTANTGLAPHSLRACDRDALQALEAFQAEQSPSAKRPVHIHIAEQQAEVEACIDWSGKRPVEWLFDEVPVNRNWCLIHATHTKDHELRLMAQSDCVTGLCPTTEANLGDGFFDAAKLVELGGSFGIGSDSQISVSPVEELRWLEYGQRLLRTSRNVLIDGDKPLSTGRFLYEQAIAGGQQAANSPAGSISVGNRADLLVLNDQHPILYGRVEDSVLDSYLFSGNRQLIDFVMVNGRIVVEHGRAIEAERINVNYRAAIDRLSLLA